MRVNLSTALEIIGLLLVLAAAFTWDIRAGAAVLGSLFVAVGYLTGAEPEVIE